MRKMKQNISSYLELCKVKISLCAALSAITGFLSVSPKFRTEIFLLISGVFLLACGSSALNQYQERKTDALMKRTKNRPLPSGRTGGLQALGFSVLLISAGCAMLFATGNRSALLLGLFASFWYNGVYTYLKKKTALAVIPGALVGAIPPVIGWMTGGGNLRDPRLLALCFFFFMWQVPHFWLTLLHHGKEYEGAGLPSLSGIFSRAQLVRITSHWIFATVVSCLFMSLYGLVNSRLMTISLFGASLWFIRYGISLLRDNGVSEMHSHAVFKRINYYMLFIVFLVSFDRVTYNLINML
jgi:protoheme IX farnesyltransferase